MKKRTWKQRILRWVILIHYGDEHALCPHNNVELISAHPVTLAPLHGKCRTCKKLVKAHTVWETND